MDVVDFFRESKSGPPVEDWGHILSKTKGIHRGLAVELPEDVHNVVHDHLQYSPEKRAQALLDHIQQTGGVGRHWTTDEKVAHKFAQGNHQRGRTRVVIHAHTPDLEHVQTDEDKLGDYGSYRHDNWMGGEKEVPLKEGAPVTVHGVTWYGPRNKKTTVHMDGIQHTASVAPSVVEFFREQQKTAAEDYHMSHGAPGPHETNAPWHEAMGTDPDEPVTVYRAAPGGTRSINKGDWVTPSADYAHQHARQYDDSPDWPVHTAEVPAKHLWTDHNDANEWGYHGPRITEPDQHHEEGHTTPFQEPPKQKRQRAPRRKKSAEEFQGHTLALSPEEHAYIHDPSVPEHERAARVLGHVRDKDARHPDTYGRKLLDSSGWMDSAQDAHTHARYSGNQDTPHPKTKVLEQRHLGDEHPHSISWVPERGHRYSVEGTPYASGKLAGRTAAAMLDLYHRTTPEAAEAIHREKRMTSKETRAGSGAPVFFSNRRDGEYSNEYGDGVVHVRVPEHMAELDDEFEDGEQHYSVDTSKLRPHHFVDSPKSRTAAGTSEIVDLTHLKPRGKQKITTGLESHAGASRETPPTEDSVSNMTRNYQFADGQSWDEVKAGYDASHPSHREMREDIRQHGVREPIIVDYNQDPPEVVDGHTRLMHAEALGMDKVPVRHNTFAGHHYYGFQDDYDPPKRTAYYHGTAVERVEQILPSGRYAYATTDQEAARRHAKTAAEASGRSPVVYVVEPVGAVEQHGAEAWSQGGWRVVGDV